MTLALFDLDHTLVSADTPALWFQFLIEKGMIRECEIRQSVEKFAEDYDAGELNYREYMHFELATLKGHKIQDLLVWRNDFRERYIKPHITEQARALVERHRALGHTLAIITATNSFIATAGAEAFAITSLLATQAESENGYYTGSYSGIECFQIGKIHKLQEWMASHGHTLRHSWFYSDSSNDLPLLEHVDNPVVVNADKNLGKIAKERGWPSLELRL